MPALSAPQILTPDSLRSSSVAAKPTDRTGDFVAALFLSVGTAMFLFGRRALTLIAHGKYTLPAGYTWVARAEMHDRQTTVGMGLVIAGIVVAIASAAYHAWQKRRISN